VSKQHHKAFELLEELMNDWPEGNFPEISDVPTCAFCRTRWEHSDDCWWLKVQEVLANDGELPREVLP